MVVWVAAVAAVSAAEVAWAVAVLEAAAVVVAASVPVAVSSVGQPTQLELPDTDLAQGSVHS